MLQLERTQTLRPHSYIIMNKKLLTVLRQLKRHRAADCAQTGKDVTAEASQDTT